MEWISPKQYPRWMITIPVWLQQHFPQTARMRPSRLRTTIQYYLWQYHGLPPRLITSDGGICDRRSVGNVGTERRRAQWTRYAEGSVAQRCDGIVYVRVWGKPRLYTCRAVRLTSLQDVDEGQRNRELKIDCEVVPLIETAWFAIRARWPIYTCRCHITLPSLRGLRQKIVSPYITFEVAQSQPQKIQKCGRCNGVGTKREAP
jgi:hypothetical protein